MYFSFNDGLDNIKQEARFTIFENSIVLETPNMTYISESVEEVHGNCAKNTLLEEILSLKGIETEFLAGDPIKFKGTVLGIFQSPTNESTFFVKIKIDDYLYLYSMILEIPGKPKYCRFLEVTA